MPTYNLPLRADTIQAIIERTDGACSLIVRDLLEDNAELMKISSHYCRDDRGTAADGSFEMDLESMLIREDLTGELILGFQELAHYGCENMNVQDDREVEIPFRIFPGELRIVLEVPESSRYSYWHREDEPEPD